MTQKVNSRKIQRWFKMVLAFFAVAVIIASCSDKDDNDDALTNNPAQPTDNVQPAQPTPDAPKTYTLSIPATLDGDASLSKAVTLGETTDGKPTATGRFDESEIIHVYNVTKSAMVSDNTHYLTPTNISTDGKSCTLSGTLAGTIEVNDEITLLYNLSRIEEYDPKWSYFNYNFASDIIDGGIAEGLTVTSTDGNPLTTESPAVFKLCQSIFRFKFTDGDGNPINVKKLLVESSSVADKYWPLQDSYSGLTVVSSFVTATSDYFNVSLCIKETNTSDALSFTVIDDNNKVYKGTRNAPSAGFKNGEYYYNTTPIQLEYQMTLKEPTITWGEGTNEVNPDEYYNYVVYGDNNKPSTLAISGQSIGYRFYLNNGSSTTLANLTAIKNDHHFIYSAGDLNLTISGTNTITCNGRSIAILVDGNLKISGAGTLTVTVNSPSMKGLDANNYNYNTNYDLKALAADDNTTVTCSEMTDNGDGTYTWTYTVGGAGSDNGGDPGDPNDF